MTRKSKYSERKEKEQPLEKDCEFKRSEATKSTHPGPMGSCYLISPSHGIASPQCDRKICPKVRK